MEPGVQHLARKAESAQRYVSGAVLVLEQLRDVMNYLRSLGVEGGGRGQENLT